MPRDTFAFYRSYVNAVRCLDEKLQLKVLNILFDYALDDLEPDVESFEKSMFMLIKPQIDSANKRYEKSIENGKKGGNPNFQKGKSNPYYSKKDNPKITQDNLNVDVYVDVDDNENVDEYVNVNGNVPSGYTPPQLSFLASLIEENDWNVDAQEFYDHYKQNGWKTAQGNLIHNWDKLLKYWHDNEKSEKRQTKYKGYEGYPRLADLAD